MAQGCHDQVMKPSRAARWRTGCGVLVIAECLRIICVVNHLRDVNVWPVQPGMKVLVGTWRVSEFRRSAFAAAGFAG